MSDDDAIVKEFLVESYENLDRLDQDLVVLEKDPANRDTLASIFRTIHTIKGTSGFLAFNLLEALTHVGENLLARLRDGVVALSPEITTALLAMVDAVREMLKSIEESGKEGNRKDQELIASLTRLLEPAPKGGTETQTAESSKKTPPVPKDVQTLTVLPAPTEPAEVSEPSVQATQQDEGYRCTGRRRHPSKRQRSLWNDRSPPRSISRYGVKARATAPYVSTSVNLTGS